MVDPTRRHFLTATGALGAAGLTGITTPVDEVPMPARWDTEVDVIVIGTGLAGMGAGMVAAEKRLDLSRWQIPRDHTMPVNPRLNYTQGGARINHKAQVLRYTDGRPIPALYCAGEATGGLHGRERLTACSMPECEVFGLIAGDNVLAEPAG